MKVRMVGRFVSTNVGVARFGVVHFERGIANIAEAMFERVADAVRRTGATLERVEEKVRDVAAPKKPRRAKKPKAPKKTS
jgi:hypothetical protein